VYRRSGRERLVCEISRAFSLPHLCLFRMGQLNQERCFFIVLDRFCYDFSGASIPRIHKGSCEKLGLRKMLVRDSGRPFFLMAGPDSHTGCMVYPLLLLNRKVQLSPFDLPNFETGGQGLESFLFLDALQGRGVDFYGGPFGKSSRADPYHFHDCFETSASSVHGSDLFPPIHARVL